MDKCYLFAGPSLSPRARSSALAQLVRVLPPVARGDVATLVQNRKPSVLVLADGRFQEVMSVAHAEIREALACGWKVWGLASIGAIRAYEMRHLGMRGYGRVYDLFLNSRDFQDDEVALLHGSNPPYLSGSEPLVHLRFALSEFVRRSILERKAAETVARRLKGLWYGDRTLSLFEHLALGFTHKRQRDLVKRAIACFDQFRIKQRDLESFLAGNPSRLGI